MKTGALHYYAIGAKYTASRISRLVKTKNIRLITIKFLHPEIFNTDQGSQYASENFFKPLKAPLKTQLFEKNKKIIGVQRRGEAPACLFRHKNIFEAKSRTADYVNFYNSRRLHAALDYKTPNEVYFENLHRSKNHDKFIKLTG